MILGPSYEQLGFTVLRPGLQQPANRRPTHSPTPRIRQTDPLPHHHVLPRHRTGLRVAGLAPGQATGTRNTRFHDSQALGDVPAHDSDSHA